MGNSTHTSHTLRDWYVKHITEYQDHIPVKEYYVISSSSGSGNICETDNASAESLANAKLIATAPKLLQRERDNHDVMLAIHTALSSSDFNKEDAQQLLRDAMAEILKVIKETTE
jgi:hypothetical protein